MAAARRPIDEQGFIDRIVALAPRAPASILLGIGDDAALLAPPRGRRIVLATDFLTEGVHFRSAWTPPRLLGRKAIAVNLSDIAAMGARAWACVLGVGLPRGTDVRFARALARGLSEQARRHGVAIVGGDTCAARALFVSVALAGTVAPGRAVRRAGARPGDALYVTGALGASHAGLALLRRGGRAASAAARAVVRAHLDPAPRAAAGAALGESGMARAMIDLSDGLAQDLPRLCRASGTGALLDEAAIPLAPAAERVLGQARARRAALVGGEDYELLFAARDADAPRLDRLARRLRLPITRVGDVLPKREGIVLLRPGGHLVPLARVRGGFRHFGG